MKMLLFGIFSLASLFAGGSTQWTEEDRKQEAEQISLWKEKISASSEWSNENKLIEFTLGLKALSYRRSMDEHNPEIDRLYKRMQEVVIAIPSHSDYFTDKIEKSWNSNAEYVRTIESDSEWRAAREKLNSSPEYTWRLSELSEAMWGDYVKVCSENLGMLAHVPSTGSVKALGRYLQKRDEPGIVNTSRGTGFMAAESLTELISDGPMQTWMASWEDVPKWQQWFDEVQAGKRTFRFVGSDVDYTLDGPIDAKVRKRIGEKNPERLPPGERGKATGANEKQGESSGLGSVSVGALIATILLCLAAFVFHFKRRQS